MTELERLQKRIAKAGIASRRKAEQMIINGRVKVNGKIVVKLGSKVNEKDTISVDDQDISGEKFEYYLLNKPSGYVSSNKSYPDQPSVTELIKTESRIFPVGRLDMDTTGVLLLTNDGDLTQKLTHPKHRIKRTYEAWVKGIVQNTELDQLTKPIRFDNEIYFPQAAKILKTDLNRAETFMEITIAEGKNHEIKKILEFIDHPVIKLNRNMFAGITLGELKSGQYRPLSDQEVKRIKR
ncbi:rRNA pseudouridine synthase [Oenococcus sicerae]|uniref:Pseudouridine synthase n=1 Tax=Oenococcus sicerae TaxID=2203724 RepID=A0AAJ1VMK5_9LACO|nr:pseudouridine synthase [Oenococcus sicerae]MDN6899751.1 rRNA pseudouridine synthase [Oenococcus sicerae]QAS70440.1 rRNA pseudouridine synthase [Oenococcus sicerae]VDK14234.1 Ribosomal large subunit pseudouridine synthase B [Oenococcus sicerae]